MPTSILSVHILTDDNIDELIRLHTQWNTTFYGLPGVTIKVGNVIVEETIDTPDIFDPAFGIRNCNFYLATREEFDSKFVINEDANRTETFALITKKN